MVQPRLVQLDRIQRPLHQQGFSATTDSGRGAIQGKEQLCLVEEGIVGAVAVFGLLAREGAAGEGDATAEGIAQGKHEPPAVEPEPPALGRLRRQSSLGQGDGR